MQNNTATNKTNSIKLSDKNSLKTNFAFLESDSMTDDIFGMINDIFGLTAPM